MKQSLEDNAYRVEFEMEDVCWHNKTMVILIGLQASGKSTFFEQYFKEKDFAHVNLDSLHSRNKENVLIEECIEKGQSFVVDNTNPTCADRSRYMDMVKGKGYKTVCVFMQSILKDCIERNELRDRVVPQVAIAGTSNKLEMPSYTEGFDKIYFAKIDKTKFNWFLIDEWKGD